MLTSSRRPCLDAVEIGKITQGTVFTCATNPRYKGKQVLGLTITARCDVSQNKYRILNYVPVVKLRDWLELDGLEILLDRERKDYYGSIKSVLKQAGISESILLSVPLSKIGEENFPKDVGSKAEKIVSQRYWAAVDGLDEMLNIERSSASEAYRRFAVSSEKKVSELIKSLSKHDVLGCYFLETLDLDDGSDSYVALLREVTTLQKEVVDLLATGIPKERWLQKFPSTTGLSFDDDDFAMPVAQLASPTTEHILQCFATLFGRIGIADPDKDLVDKIAERHLKFEADA